MSLCAGDILVSTGVLTYLAHQGSSSRLALEHSPTSYCVIIILRCVRMTSHIIALLNLLGLAIDHYIGIVMPLQYPNLMNRGRANILIITCWITACILGFSKFYVPFPLFSYCNPDKMSNYCETVFCSPFNGEYIVFIMAVLCFIAMAFCYAKIYQALKKCQSNQSQITICVKKNHRGLITTTLIVIIFLLCWLPYCLFEIAMLISLQVYADDFFASLKYFKLISEIDYYLYDILLLNSILDPMVYAMRMKEIQKGYKQLTKTCRRKKGHTRGKYDPSDQTNLHGNQYTAISLAANEEEQ